MPDEELKPPLEIPWKLASTTQQLVSGGPDETTVSLFFHEPDGDAVIGVTWREARVPQSYYFDLPMFVWSS